MAKRVSKTKSERFFTVGSPKSARGWCRSFGHIPRRYGDGIFCQNCEKQMTEAELAAWDKANPRKTFHKRYKKIGYGGVETLDSFARSYGLDLREGVK